MTQGSTLGVVMLCHAALDRAAQLARHWASHGCPVVIGHQEEDGAREVLVTTAERLGCPVSVYGQDFMAHEEYGRLIYQDEDGLADLPLPRLPGRHQYANSAAAIRAVKAAGFKSVEVLTINGFETQEL